MELIKGILLQLSMMFFFGGVVCLYLGWGAISEPKEKEMSPYIRLAKIFLILAFVLLASIITCHYLGG
jgi:hypothetical protein